MLKRTPLYAAHQKRGARLIEFGGWEMPVQYSSIMDEHLCVRRAAGIFDISHMGEVRVSGPAALEFLNHILTNDVRKLSVGMGQYTLLCNERGGVVDDLYVFRVEAESYFMVINASRIEPDVQWITDRMCEFPNRQKVCLEHISDVTAAVAVQGPRVAEFINECFPGASCGGASVKALTEMQKNQIIAYRYHGQTILISRTGYTGEDGFEIMTPASMIEAVWDDLLAKGHKCCLQPAGLGARDTLRTEVCYPLYGHELDENTTPIEAGVGFFVALDKGAFIGRELLAAQKAQGVSKKCVAFKMAEKSAPPRPQYAICEAGNPSKLIGVVVSGTQSPSLNLGIGMGYVSPEFAKPGTQIAIEIRSKLFLAEVAPKPLYRSSTAK